MRQFFRSQLLIGFLIGLAATFNVPIVQASCSLYDPPFDCGSLPGNLTPDQAQFMSTQCDVWATLFPNTTEPTVVYEVDEPITTTGDYKVTALGGGRAALNVVWCSTIPNVPTSPAVDAVMTNVRGATVVGHLVGPNQVQIPIQAIVCSYKSASTGDEVTRFTIVARVSEQVVAQFANCTRLSGGLRLIDVSTCISYSLDAQLPGNITDSWFTSSDLSTIYCVFDHTPGGNPMDQVACIKKAYKDYQDDTKACGSSYDNVLIDAMAAYVLALAACAFTGPGAPVCIALAVAALSVATAIALGRLIHCNNEASTKLKNALRACGLRLLEA